MNMKTKIIGGLFGISSLLVTGLANAATVQVTPASSTVANGESFPLTITGDFTETTIGGGFSLSWDTAVLQLLTSDADIITGLDSNGWDFSTVNPSAPGTLDVLSATFFGDFTGSFDIVTLEFQALQVAVNTEAALTFSGVQGSDWTALNGDAIPVDYLGANIKVDAIPVPAAVWFFGTGMIGMVGIARRRKALLS